MSAPAQTLASFRSAACCVALMPVRTLAYRPLLVACASAAIAAALVATIVTAPRAAAAAVPRQTGLSVVSISSPPRMAPAGATFHVSDTTRNVRGAAKRRTWIVYLASPDRRAGRGQVFLGARRVRPLPLGRGSHARRPVQIPTRTKARTYWMLACSATTARQRAFDPSSCRVARHRIRVLPAAPRSIAAPRIAGQPTDGKVLTADSGRWTGLAPIQYARQWQRCDGRGSHCAPIPGATTPSYSVSSTDVGATIRFTVLASNQHGRWGAQSRPTATVRPAPPANTVAPGVTGRAVVGETVTADPGTWAGTPPLAAAFQWQRCPSPGACADIAGATGQTYTLAAGDSGPTLRVVVVTSNVAGAVTAASAPVPTGLFQNPVFSATAAPDPFVFNDRGTYLEFHTGSLFPMLRSTDLMHWTPAGSALRRKPSWVTDAGDWHPWAPSVIHTSHPCPGASSGSCYVMYFTALSQTWGVNCIGVATAATASGPYTARDQPLQLTSAAPTDEPIGCGDAGGQGNIDPSPFIDSDGNAYLYMSSDTVASNGLSQYQPVISVVPLTSDLLAASGGRTALFSGDPGTWEAANAPTPVVEGPTMVKHNGTYYLMYSGGTWRGSYGMGYAISTSPVGGFIKQPTRLLTETASVLSPGGGDSLVTGPHGGTWLVYHGRDGSYDNPRTLRIDRFSWQPGSPDVPVVDGPTGAPVAIAP